MYTLSEFRKLTRQAFNDAREGHEVVIERYGDKFQLVCLVDEPLPGHTQESIPGKEPRVKDEYTVPGTIEGTGFYTPMDIPPPDTVPYTGLKDRPLPPLREQVKALQDSKPLSLCKNGHAIPEGRSKCMGKGCKYS